MQAPTLEEVRARAEQQKLIEPGADLPRTIHRTVAQALLAERQAELRAAMHADPSLVDEAGPLLLSRFTYETDAGLVTVDVTLTPRKEQPNGKAL